MAQKTKTTVKEAKAKFAQILQILENCDDDNLFVAEFDDLAGGSYTCGIDDINVSIDSTHTVYFSNL